MDNLKVIFHIDESERWDRVLGNVKNLLKQVEQDKIKIEVLANGKSVDNYIKDNDQNEESMRELSESGVEFAACNNSLNNLNIEKEELFDFVEIVPAGVLELAQKQAQGYGYIKP